MEALKLQFIPTKKQYEILDEAFNKWASIENRYNKYTHTKKLDEKAIKEKFKPKKDVQILQFSETMVNQQAKKDNADLIKAMEEQGKQKEEELYRLEERKLSIESMLNNENEREVNPKNGNMRPRGWFKFHTKKYWNDEIEKINKLIKKRKKTIEKIRLKRIYFKPKRIGIWSNEWKVNFKQKKLLIKPFVNRELVLNLITEPIQPHKKSSLRSKQFLESQIRNFVNFAVHSEFFGLANNESPLISFKINQEFIIPKINEKFSDKDEDKFNIFEKRVKDYIEILERKIGRKLSSEEIKIIDKEKNNLWNKEKELNEIKKIIDGITNIKKQKHLPRKSELLKDKWEEVNKKRSKLLSHKYLTLISELKDELTKQKRELLDKKYSKFDYKINKLKTNYNLNFDEGIIKKEGDIVFSKPDEFYEHKFSDEYITVINNITTSLLNYNGFLDLNKYPILLRKPIKKMKKLKNLKPNEWKYYIQFGYEKLNIPVLEVKNILGIDRGLTHILAYSVFDTDNNKFIINKLEPNPIVNWKWKLRKLKRSIQHLERRLRSQKKIKIPENQMKKRLRGVEDKIENFYHNLSRKIVDVAKKTNASIVFERLEGQGLKQHTRRKSGRLKALNYALSLFDYGKVAKLIKYKAEKEGIPVYQIDPAYTSQNCAKCILELGKFAEPVTLFYLDELKEGGKLDNKLLEGTGLKEAQIDKVTKKEIKLTGKDNDDREIKLVLFIKYGKIILSRGYYKAKEKGENKFEIEEELAEFQTKKENGRTAVLDYIYTRGKEKINGDVKYTGNKKVGYCSKHGQIDADLNASRTIALCKHFEINNPKIWK